MIVNFGFMLGRRAARCTVVLGCSVLLEADCRGESLLSFGRDIRPILSNNCYACHGPDKSTRKPKKTPLRLDLEKEAHAEFIVPGEPEGSEVYLRIITDDDDDVMPPSDSIKKLTQKEKDLIRRWIKSGAKYESHWSYVTPVLPAPPQFEDNPWPRNAIDRFVLARLEKEGLAPSKEASRRMLVRRLTLDLTGLPPTLAEVEQFLNDRSPDAYEKVVDRLLNSPAYGEHMARPWLDAARYGDTHGLHLDNYREFWPYRDWVIDAFNQNKPFNEFVREQLAGDLLPNPSSAQLTATGYNRAHVTTNEGGSIKEEVLIRNVMDRVTTFATVFMGMTSGCAVCHDHKFDPLKQKEFFQLSAYFNSLDGNPMDGNNKAHAPVIQLPTDEQEKAIKEHQEQLSFVRQEIRKKLDTSDYEEPENPKPLPAPQPVETVWAEDDLPPGAKPEGEWKMVEKDSKLVYSGEKATVQTATGLKQNFFTGAEKPIVIADGDKLFTYIYSDPENPPKQVMLQWNDGTWEHRAYWGESLIEWGKDGTVSRRRVGELPTAGEWVRLEVGAGSVGLKPGAKVNGWAFTQFDGTVYWDQAGWVTSTKDKQEYVSFNLWLTALRQVEKPALPDKLLPLIKKESLNDSGLSQLKDHFVEHVCLNTRKQFEPLHQSMKEWEKKIADTKKNAPTTLVWKELKKPRDAYVLDRGLYDQRRDKVTRKTPEFLPPFPEGAPQDRLGLAEWLLNGTHPLTARVTVNRFWQQVFGAGIVKTAGDFGMQGEWPTHPELLDWLAVHFTQSGWNVKELIRLVVTSSTYRQTSKASPELYDLDPENRLFARGPRFRLDAEALRDQALALSGLLVEKVGGPGVKPPQPDGLWFVVGYTGSNTVRFKKDNGPEKVHRRSLYTFWKRTAPPPQMNTFDAPSREVCSVRRERTNTPLQALLMMNDPQYFEAARGLAQRIMQNEGGSIEERLAYGFRLATLRKPSASESRSLVSAYNDFYGEFKSNADAAKGAVAVGELSPDSGLDPVELATCTMVANIILNLDEVLNKG